MLGDVLAPHASSLPSLGLGTYEQILPLVYSDIYVLTVCKLHCTFICCVSLALQLGRCLCIPFRIMQYTTKYSFVSTNKIIYRSMLPLMQNVLVHCNSSNNMLPHPNTSPISFSMQMVSHKLHTSFQVNLI